jgi:hypothetical protein
MVLGETGWQANSSARPPITRAARSMRQLAHLETPSARTRSGDGHGV